MLSSEKEKTQRGAEPKPRFVDQLSAFLHKYRIVLLVLLIALVVFVVTYFTWTEWHHRTQEKSTLMAEKAQVM